MKSPHALSDHVILKDIGKSHVESRSFRNIPIEIGQFKGKCIIVVADITILLGFDFFRTSQGHLQSTKFFNFNWKNETANQVSQVLHKIFILALYHHINSCEGETSNLLCHYMCQKWCKLDVDSQKILKNFSPI